MERRLRRNRRAGWARPCSNTLSATKSLSSRRSISTKGVTSPIIGATKEKHLDEATTALDVELTGEKLAYLEELYVPHPIVANSSLFIVNYTGQTLRGFGSIEEARATIAFARDYAVSTLSTFGTSIRKTALVHAS